MAGIRPFTRTDLPAVAALMDARLPEWTRDGSLGSTFLAETLLDYPWADPDVPSLVATDREDEVVGFVGLQVRRLRFDDRQLLGVCCSHLVVADDPRAGVWGTLLLREAFAGPQDVTWTDSANDVVVRLWLAQGGFLDYTRCCDWMLVLKPLNWAGGVLAAKARRDRVARNLAPVGALPIQAAGPRLLGRWHPAPEPEVSSEEATAEEIVAALPTITRDFSLRVDYDAPHLEHLLGQVQATDSPVEHSLVRRAGAPIGWYAYLSPAGSVSRVLHLSAPEAETDAVVGELVDHARTTGSAVLTGRFEPHLYRPLRARLAVLGFARQPLITTRDPEIREVLSTPSSLFTQLDGEWFVI